MNNPTNRYLETFNTWDKVADLYQDKFMDLTIYDDTYDAFIQLIKEQEASILEVGCGPGNITRYLLSKRADFKILGIDIAPNMIRLASQNNPTARFKTMDSREISTLGNKYDAIICGFCLPYLSEKDRLKLIIDSKNLLVDNGILYISFVEGNYEQSAYQTGGNGGRVFFYYHESEKLHKELTANDFQILNITNVDYKKQSKTEKHTIVMVRKQVRI